MSPRLFDKVDAEYYPRGSPMVFIACPAAPGEALPSRSRSSVKTVFSVHFGSDGMESAGFLDCTASTSS